MTWGGVKWGRMVWDGGVLILSSIFMIEKHDACYLSICLQKFLSPDRKLFITVTVYYQLEEYFLAKLGKLLRLSSSVFVYQRVLVDGKRKKPE